MFKVVRAVFSPEQTSITYDQAARVSHATIGMRVGDGSESMLVLAKSGFGQLWLAGEHLAIVTQKGRVTQTQGLERNLSRLVSYGSEIPALTPVLFGQRLHTRWFVDLDDMQVHGALLECDAVSTGIDTVTLFGKAIRTMRITEACTSASIRWSFTNVYWVSPTSGIVWRSVQHVYPGVAALTIRILRPPAG